MNGLLCYTAFKDTIWEVELDIFCSSSAEHDPNSICPLSSDCRNALHQSIEDLGCCTYSSFVLSGMKVNLTDILWDVCGLPQSVAYICDGTTDPTAPTDPTGLTGQSDQTDPSQPTIGSTVSNPTNSTTRDGSGYTHEQIIFPVVLDCSEDRLNELDANLPSGCTDGPDDLHTITDQRIKVFCECGEPGIKLFTECYSWELEDPISAMCSPTVNGVPCYTAFDDTIQKIFVDSDICSAEPDLAP